MASRNTRFVTHEPLTQHPSLDLDPRHTTGPFSFLNPTRANFHHLGTSTTSDSSGTAGHGSGNAAGSDNAKVTPGYQFKWNSRNNRKGRHAVVIDPAVAEASGIQVPKPTTNASAVLQGIWRMFTYFPVWDVSWLVAMIFTLGSAVWVINAFFAFLPLLAPWTAFPEEGSSGGGISAFIGATIFEIGSILLMIEAVNENREGCFGWALEEAIENEVRRFDTNEAGKRQRLTPNKSSCSHHHVNKSNFVGKGANTDNTDASPALKAQDAEKLKNWVWFPSWTELKTHYIRELGFLACSSQMFGATVFWISGFTALPGVLNKLSPGLEDGIYWTPQVVGAIGFIVSGTLFMIETQEKWWKPAPSVLGWHIGLWNLIGAVGFFLSGAFGYDIRSWAQYQAACSTFWGSWAFLIGSVIQLYESLQKYPVVIKRS